MPLSAKQVGRAPSGKVGTNQLAEVLKSHKTYVLSLKALPAVETRNCKQKRVSKGGALYQDLQKLSRGLSFTKKNTTAALRTLSSDNEFVQHASETLRKNLRFVAQALLKPSQPAWLKACMGLKPVLNFEAGKRKSPEPEQEPKKEEEEEEEEESAQEESPCCDGGEIPSPSLVAGWGETIIDQPPFKTTSQFQKHF